MFVVELSDSPSELSFLAEDTVTDDFVEVLGGEVKPVWEAVNNFRLFGFLFEYTGDKLLKLLLRGNAEEDLPFSFLSKLLDDTLEL